MRMLTVLVLGLCAVHCYAAPQELQIPKAVWEPIFFRAINRVTDKAGWEELREKSIPNGSQEIRIWIGFGPAYLQGFRLQHDGIQWTGVSILDKPLGVETKNLIFPAEWNNDWEKIKAYGIFSLPDSSVLEGEVRVRDGESYVVEFNDGRLYRAYEYGNPSQQPWPEARSIIEIVALLRKLQ